VWNSTLVDGYEVTARYIAPEKGKAELRAIDAEWHSHHVQQSQYCLQIVKCNNNSCCGQHRSNYNNAFPQRFLPPPVPYCTTTKVVYAEVSDTDIY